MGYELDVKTSKILDDKFDRIIAIWELRYGDCSSISNFYNPETGQPMRKFIFDLTSYLEGEQLHTYYFQCYKRSDSQLLLNILYTSEWKNQLDYLTQLAVIYYGAKLEKSNRNNAVCIKLYAKSLMTYNLFSEELFFKDYIKVRIEAKYYFVASKWWELALEIEKELPRKIISPVPSEQYKIKQFLNRCYRITGQYDKYFEERNIYPEDKFNIDLIETMFIIDEQNQIHFKTIEKSDNPII